MSLKEIYQKKVQPALRAKFNYRNLLAVPKIVKVVINTGLGRLRASDGRTLDPKILEEAEKIFSLITGQKPARTLAKKAIADFKVRKGQILGLKVTLRGRRMYDFLERLINLALPRTRDFRGLDPKVIDEKGNLTIGLKEHIVFPEISQEDIHHIFGLEAAIKTTAGDKEKGLELLKLMGFPFRF